VDDRRRDEREQQSCRDHEQRRLDDEPPETLAVRVQERHPPGLEEGPGDAAEHRQRREREHRQRSHRATGPNL
jgi:hypothetical protein